MIETNNDVYLLKNIYEDGSKLSIDDIKSIMGDDYTKNELFYDAKNRSFSNKDFGTVDSFIFFIVRYDEFYDDITWNKYLEDELESISKRFIKMQDSDFLINRLPLSLIYNPDKFILSNITNIYEPPSVKMKRFLKNSMSVDLLISIFNSGININKLRLTVITFIDLIVDDHNANLIIEGLNHNDQNDPIILMIESIRELNSK